MFFDQLKPNDSVKHINSDVIHAVKDVYKRDDRTRGLTYCKVAVRTGREGAHETVYGNVTCKSCIKAKQGKDNEDTRVDNLLRKIDELDSEAEGYVRTIQDGEREKIKADQKIEKQAKRIDQLERHREYLLDKESKLPRQ